MNTSREPGDRPAALEAYGVLLARLPPPDANDLALLASERIARLRTAR